LCNQAIAYILFYIFVFLFISFSFIKKPKDYTSVHVHDVFRKFTEFHCDVGYTILYTVCRGQKCKVEDPSKNKNCILRFSCSGFLASWAMLQSHHFQ